MKYVRIAFIFSLVLMLFAGCSKEEIQPDPLTIDDSALKGAKVKNGPKHFVPLKGTFEVSIDLPTKIITPGDPPVTTQEVIGDGNATHMGKTSVVIYQTWERRPMPPGPPGGDGSGLFVFTAANGDILGADYSEGKTIYVFIDGKFDHVDVTMPCIINKDESSGRFSDAEGSFTWSGIFYPPPVNKGYATIVDGEIRY